MRRITFRINGLVFFYHLLMETIDGDINRITLLGLEKKFALFVCLNLLVEAAHDVNGALDTLIQCMNHLPLSQ